ncbi:MAG: DUF4270 domain-containing protein [Bacteroidetes bacterium]|jgi:hypothetical protein|nr:DUF4270 domain-containing protein [Bacteroidota bacterium]MBT6686815.1 DUF4270 domain-containing protein [Bacteroidota bacterium]MBT7144145.1 DUF4270 domain-containing protein [Bacteroidota bacterium]MBT7490081.1 DUF4270 domain-containing protein [Bacteroidota bacterium]
MNKNQVKSLKVTINTIFFLSFFLFFQSCQEENQLGYNLVPDGDKIILHSDSLSVVAASTITDHLITTDERSLCLLGSCEDPVFGSSKAEFVTEFRLSKNAVRFGSNPVIDSIFLYLDYAGYYGDTSIMQNIKIHKLSENINDTLTYFSNSHVSFEPAFFNKYYKPLPSDTNNLKIKLPDELGQELLDLDTTFLEDNDSFKDAFKGLYFSTDQIGASIVYFDLLSSVSKITLYYSNDTSILDGDTLSFDFLLNEYCARFNIYDHQFQNTNISQYLNVEDADHIYLQSMGGLKAELQFPFADTWLETVAETEQVAIAKAELVFSIKENTTNKFSPPEKLILELIDRNEGFDAPSDYYIDSNVENYYFNGYIDSTDYTYSINITQYFQDLIDQNIENKGLFLLPSKSKVSANRVILNNSGNNKILLKLTYTKL